MSRLSWHLKCFSIGKVVGDPWGLKNQKRASDSPCLCCAHYLARCRPCRRGGSLNRPCPAVRTAILRFPARTAIHRLGGSPSAPILNLITTKQSTPCVDFTSV